MSDFEKTFFTKIRLFERRFLNKFTNSSIGNRVWSFLKWRLVKNRFYFLSDLEAEFMPIDRFRLTFVITYGWLTFFIVLAGTLLAGLLAHYFPMFLTDQLISFLEFCWLSPFVFLFFLYFSGIFILLCVPAQNHRLLSDLSFGLSYLVFVFFLVVLIRFDYSSDELQFAYRVYLDFPDNIANIFIEPSVKTFKFAQPFFNFHLAADAFSIVLALLASFLFLLCDLINSRSPSYYFKESVLLYQLLAVLTIFSFLVFDLVIFYLVFEAVLIPMFLIIGLLGSRERKVYAAFKFFLYTLVCSLFTLAGLVILVSTTNSTDVEFLSNYIFSPEFQKTLFLLFFLSFAVKLPIPPFHLWLPEAHVEAPTTGSIILAGILLKLGGYGFFRFLLPFFPDGVSFFSPLLCLFGAFGVIYASLVAMRQIDIKKVIAYSSVAHMAFIPFAFTFITSLSLIGGFFILISHGFISSALFYLIGVLYDRYKTKLIFYYSGLATVMPIFSLFLFLFTLANIALPSMSSFIGEFFVISGLASASLITTFFAASGAILGVCYALWLFNRIVFGSLSVVYIRFYQDLTLEDFSFLFLLIIPVLWFGCFPTGFLQFIVFDSNMLEADFYLKEFLFR